ncbi:hypothetical protein ABB02_00937 [Clostridiaceae bacterium JG1575]|nr:hypothetical protein ABB02_00937 [Clostridiaceae bacterium JG1575]
MKAYFTSLVRCKDSESIEVVSVKSTVPVELSMFVPLSRVLSRIYVGKPVRRGDLICTNVLNQGIQIVATKTVE